MYLVKGIGSDGTDFVLQLIRKRSNGEFSVAQKLVAEVLAELIFPQFRNLETFRGEAAQPVAPGLAAEPSAAIRQIAADRSRRAGAQQRIDDHRARVEPFIQAAICPCGDVDAAFAQSRDVLILARFQREHADLGPRVVQVARRHQPIATVVAGSDEYQDPLAAHVQAGLDDARHSRSRALHHCRVRMAQLIGSRFNATHLIDSHSLHGYHPPRLLCLLVNRPSAFCSSCADNPDRSRVPR